MEEEQLAQPLINREYDVPMDRVVHVFRNHLAPTLTLPNRTCWAKLPLAANRDMLHIMTPFANKQPKPFLDISTISKLFYFG